MRLGVLSKVFPGANEDAVFAAIAGVGLQCVQFNLESAGLPPMPDALPPDLAQRVGAAAAAHGVGIVSLQGTFNMTHPDPAQRSAGLTRLRLITSLAAELSAPYVAICVGTRDPENMWRYHPQNSSPEAWRDMVDCIRQALEIAEASDVTLAFEPEVTNVVDSAIQARRLLDELRSPRLKVTMDGANLFHAGELSRMAEILQQSFELLGADIVLAHAKDLSQDGEAGQEAAGTGLLDYDEYIRLLRKHHFNGPLLLHALTPQQAPGCVAFLRGKLATNGR